MIDFRKNIQELISFLYGQDLEDEITNALWQLIEAFKKENPHTQTDSSVRGQLSEKDAILITYGDQFSETSHSPLQSLNTFLHAQLQEVISGVHILPFYPYSSDDGFSVIDYYQVKPELGTWQDIASLGENFQLMFDLVANHVSIASAWFQGFLKGDEPYTQYFPAPNPDTDLSAVVRPRATPLLTPFQTSRGRRYVWTTFSDDQVDLDYRNPRVLLEMVNVLLFYVSHGAKILRLDAIAYLWKIPGTTCIHLPQTHAIVKLFRAILDAAAPSVLLITETNVPHAENISYFGEAIREFQGTDEAQLVYQFPLAPLILHTILTGDSTRLTDWAADLPALSPGTTFFNFTASHDGIGIRPAEGLLQQDEIHALIENTLLHGGQVSYRSNPDGSQSAYELNITWYDAVNDPANPTPEDIQRFLASQAIMLSLAGIPGIYIHSMLGSRNCMDCSNKTGRARSINREKFELEKLEQELSDGEGLKSRTLNGYRQLLQVRKQQPAFHPSALQQVIRLGADVFGILRTTDDGNRLLCLTNVTGKNSKVRVNCLDHDLPLNSKWVDQLVGKAVIARDQLLVELSAYECLWLKETLAQ